MRQYSIAAIEISWFGLDLKPGLAEGSSITEARNAPTWNQKATGQGKVVRFENPDRSGTVSILVDQESSIHQDLQALSLADRIGKNVVGPMVVKDTVSGQIFYYKNAYISTDPNEMRATASMTFTWVFNFEAVEHVSTNKNKNVIGQ